MCLPPTPSIVSHIGMFPRQYGDTPLLVYGVRFEKLVAIV
jgi:hypothetical protein